MAEAAGSDPHSARAIIAIQPNPQQGGPSIGCTQAIVQRRAANVRWRIVMRMRFAKTALAASLALAAMAAAERAYAQPARHAGPQVYDSQDNPFYRFGPRVTARPGDVVSGQA